MYVRYIHSRRSFVNKYLAIVANDVAGIYYVIDAAFK